MTDSIILVKLSTDERVHINKDEGPFFLDDSTGVNWGNVSAVINTYKYLKQIGVTSFGENLGSRNISITGWVGNDSPDEVKRQKMQLNLFVDPTEKYHLLVDGYRIECQPDKSISYSRRKQENNDFMCKFVINLFCANPLFTLENVQNKLIAHTLPKFKFPLVIPSDEGIIMGLREPSLIADIENYGAFEVGMRVEFSATGLLTNPMLKNALTNEFLKLNLTMNVGETIVVETNVGKRKVFKTDNAGNEERMFKFLDSESTWLSLSKGTNKFAYSSDTGVEFLNIKVLYEPLFLEVET